MCGGTMFETDTGIRYVVCIHNRGKLGEFKTMEAAENFISEREHNAVMYGLPYGDKYDIVIRRNL